MSWQLLLLPANWIKAVSLPWSCFVLVVSWRTRRLIANWKHTFWGCGRSQAAVKAIRFRYDQFAIGLFSVSFFWATSISFFVLLMQRPSIKAFDLLAKCSTLKTIKITTCRQIILIYQPPPLPPLYCLSLLPAIDNTRHTHTHIHTHTHHLLDNQVTLCPLPHP